ncbi:MAG: T9SS type A sorting domain-containing protein [Crocinitomicaceae bacterium]|nr:T9SS type A sorting domain-containing protein [Flavobacteriales bacterium]NQZ35003.1 T9SS type A sorting domain-containing protein [Crocinitomicaceae bacterium]
MNFTYLLLKSGLGSVIFLTFTALFGINTNAQTVSFSSSGSWIVPCGVTTATFEIWGGGGGGGGDGSNGFPAGSGGGSGGYSAVTFAGLVAGNTYTFVVGNRGMGITGNASGGPSNNGGSTTLTGAGVSLTANGGTVGGSNGGPGGVGGTASGGLTNIIGNTGGASTATISGIGSGSPNGGGDVSGCSSTACTGGGGSSFGGAGAGGGPRGGGLNSTGGDGSSGGVTISFTSTITLPNAGTDVSACGTLTLNANSPDAGWTAAWSVVSGTVTITSPSSPTSAVTGLSTGSCATLRWTFSMAGCLDVFDDVILCEPAICNDEPCNAFVLPVSSGVCSYTAGTNVGATLSTGMAEPSCATVNGPDVWYAITVPASGQVQVSGQSTTDGFDELLSIYDGSCSNLAFSGCVSGVGTNVYPLTYAGVPGSIIYLRVAEGGTGDAPFGSFSICAVEATVAGISEVLPGDTTIITCGSTLLFCDTGGQGGTGSTSTSQPPPAGNYSNNTGASWVICPSDPSQIVTLDFSSFTVESGFDKLIILSADTVIAQWTGSDGAGNTVTGQAPGECLTIVFQSDYNFTAEGWDALVSCGTTVVPPEITNACEVNNCNGGCGVWVCGDGVYFTEAGAGAGIDEINEVTGGCWGSAGEVATSWFYFTIDSPGSLAFEFVPSNSGHDINFALYGPSTNGVPPCPLLTGDAPIRCSFAAVGGINSGLQEGQTDLYDVIDGDGMAAPVSVSVGETYALVVDVYQNGQPPTETEIDFTGTAALDCTPVFLGMSLAQFNGINQGASNLLDWIVTSQMNNDYFTIVRSFDAKNWEPVESIDGDGTTLTAMYYSLEDTSPYFPVTYYRLIQTDINGGESYSDVISIATNKGDADQLVNTIFPNPASDFTTFRFEGTDVETPINVRVLNQLGQIVFDENYTLLKARSDLRINTSKLERGIYQVVFSQGDQKQIERLSIMR